jgi:hypothetical protein
MKPEDLKRTKVKFNLHGGGITQIEAYLRNADDVNNASLFWRGEKTRYFNVGQIAISLIQMSWDTWLLATIKEVTRELGVTHGINYEGAEIKEHQPYFGRVIIKYQKKHTAAVCFANTVFDKLEVQQLLPGIYDGEDFPGYDKVRLSYEQLSIIIRRRKKDWVAALENQKAVYLITDIKSGKQYVGSAYGENGMLLRRWTDYVNNGHGGNKHLRAVVGELGLDYIARNYQYAILENYNARVDKQIILEREGWWKETLGSRAFGLNGN